MPLGPRKQTNKKDGNVDILSEVISELTVWILFIG